MNEFLTYFKCCCLDREKKEQQDKKEKKVTFAEEEVIELASPMHAVSLN